MDNDKVLKLFLVGTGLYATMSDIPHLDRNSYDIHCLETIKNTIRCEYEKENNHDLSDYLTSRLLISDTTNTSVVSMRII